jgi:hypothetical protein
MEEDGMIAAFITVRDGIITGMHEGALPVDFSGTAYAGDTVVEVPPYTAVRAGENVSYYDGQWKRKSDRALVEAGLMEIPPGYKLEGDELTFMSSEEKIVAGLVPPPEGRKVVDGRLVDMSPEERRDAGLITEEQYRQFMEMGASGELNRRLAVFLTAESQGWALVDPSYEQERREKVAALLAVKEQEGWPCNPVWPEED